MSEAPALSAEAVELLLDLLELPEPLLAADLVELRPAPAARLIAAGLLAAHDHEAIATSMADHDDAPVSLAWSEAAGGLAYFSPSQGPVAVPPEQLLRRRVDMGRVLAAVTAELDLPRGRAPFELLDGLLWEIGDGRLGRRQARTPLWFARRLWDRSVQRRVAEAARARPHPRQRVILTSSRSARLRETAFLGTIVVALRDVLARPEGLAASSVILDARLGGVRALRHQGPVALSSDGRQLRINGGDPILFRSERQITAIRRLVEAYHAGERLRIAEITDARTLGVLFGGEKWKQLSRHLKSADGLWGFEP